MKIGVIGRIDADPTGASLGAAGSTGVTTRLARAETQGYAAAWLWGGAEIEAALLLSAAQLAVRTQQIALGIVAALAGSYHPIRLAEDLAVLDLMCDGRLSWALPTRLDGANGTDALAEAVGIVRRAWSGQAFSHAMPELVCHPAPARTGGPTLYEAAGPPSRAGTHHVEAATADAAAGIAFVACEGEQAEHAHVVVASMICQANDAGARARAAALPGRATLAGEPQRVRDEIEALVSGLAGDTLVLVDPEPPGVDADSAAASQCCLAEALFG